MFRNSQRQSSKVGEVDTDSGRRREQGPFRVREEEDGEDQTEEERIAILKQKLKEEILRNIFKFTHASKEFLIFENYSCGSAPFTAKYYPGSAYKNQPDQDHSRGI